MKNTIKLLILLLLGNIVLSAQIDKKFSTLDEHNSQYYIQPLINALNQVSISSISHRTLIEDESLFKVSVKGYLLYVASSQRMFYVSDKIGLGSNYSTSTILGEKGTTINSQNKRLTFPSGYNYISMSDLYLQVAANYKHYEVFIKVFPFLEVANEKVFLTSVGLRAELSSLLYEKPTFNLSVNLINSRFSLGSIMTANTINLGLEIGQSFNRLSLYSNVFYRYSLANLKYSTTGDPASLNPFLRTSQYIDKDFNMSGVFCFALGGSIKVGERYYIFGELNMSYNNMLTSGLTIEF